MDLPLLARLLVAHAVVAAPGPTAVAPATAAAASADAQLMIAQQALCQAAHAARTPDAADQHAQARKMQRLTQTYLDAWDAAGRPVHARTAVLQCGLSPVAAAYLQASTQMTLAQFALGEAAIKSALANAPEPWRAGLLLRDALCALHRHAPEAALQSLQAAQALAPDWVAVRLATAQAYLALNRPADVAFCLAPLLSATQVPDAHELEQARSLTSMAIEHDAGHISPLERTAMQNLLQMAQAPEASQQTVEMAQSLAEAVPRPRVQTAAALVALKARNAEVGRALLKAAFDQNSLDPDPARLLALYNVEHGGPTAALPCLTLAAKRDPFNIETQSLIAELSERTGDWAQAQTTLTALSRLAPKDGRHTKALARVQAQAAGHTAP